MTTATFLDLGLTPIASTLPGAPPMVAAGVTPPDFLRALTDLLSGTAPAALTTAMPMARQMPAANGKCMPVETAQLGAQSTGLQLPPDCEMPADPDLSPPPITIPKTDERAAKPDTEQKSAEPDAEAVLAWFMPPPSVAEGHPAPVVATVAGRVSTPFRMLGEMPVCEMPAPPNGKTEPTLLSSSNVAPSANVSAPLSPSAQTEPERLPPSETASMPAAPSDPAKPTPSPLSDAAPLARLPVLAGPDISADSTSTPLQLSRPLVTPTVPDGREMPSTETARPPIAPLPFAPMVAGAPVRSASAVSSTAAMSTVVEIRGPIDPARQEPAKIAESHPEIRPALAPVTRIDLRAAVAAAPAVAIALEPATPNAPTAADAAILAASGPGAAIPVAPTSSAQHAGIDLTQDPGLNRMIDRIEQLRDAAVDGVRETRIRLIPDALGPVDIAVRKEGSGDAVQVHFTAAEPATRQLIADAQPRLTELADARGVRIERATIDGGSGQTWRDDSQGRQSHHSPQSAQQPQSNRLAARTATEAEFTDERIA